MKFLSTLVIAILLSANALHAKDGIIALVGDEAISNIDVRERLDLAIFSAGIGEGDDVRAKFLPQIVQRLVDERIYQQEAKRLGIKASDDEVNAAISNIARQNKIPPAELGKFLAQRGVSINSLFEQLKSQILWNKIVARQVSAEMIVTDSEVEENMQGQSSNDSEEYQIAEIAMTPNSKGETEQAMSDILQQIRNGANFTSMAREFSSGSTAAKGGDLGWVKASDMSPKIRSIIEGLGVSQVSNVTRIGNNYYIFKLLSKRVISKASLDPEAKLRMKESIKRHKIFLKAQDYLRQLRRDFFVEVRI